MDITITAKGVNLEGQLDLPAQAAGLVIFAHGSGSGRHSPRNQYVARVLKQAAVGTLLFDLLTPQEEAAETYTRHLRFDITLLSERLRAATLWALDKAATRDIGIGLFGSSTGAAAALQAAVALGESVRAVVSRGGRPDLAGDALPRIRAATLLIVGGDDAPVIPLNEQAYDGLQCEKALRIVPGASHLFEEPGKLEIVANMAAEWFVHHLQPMAPRAG